MSAISAAAGSAAVNPSVSVSGSGNASANSTASIGLDSISADDRSMFCSLVDSCQFGPAIKSLFDRQWGSIYVDVLSAHVERKNAAIYAICQEHYNEFISSINELLKVKLDMSELRSGVLELNKRVQESGKRVIERTEKLTEKRHQRWAVQSAIDTLYCARFLLELYEKIQTLIDKKKYFAALKHLEILSRIYLPRFSLFAFAKHMENQIPKLIRSMKENVKSEFNEWLKTMRQKCVKIGETALKQIDRALQKDEKKKILKRASMFLSAATVLIHNAHGATAPSNSDDEDDEENSADGLLEKADLNFAPVYQCLHVFEALGIADQFKILYREKRKNQALALTDFTYSSPTLVSKPSASTDSISAAASTSAASPSVLSPSSQAAAGDDFLLSCSKYFSDIAGFFITEDYVLKSGNDLITRSEVEKLWEMVVVKMKGVLLDIFNSPSSSPLAFALSNSKYFMNLKHTVLVLALCLENYGFDVSELLNFLVQLRDKFESILLKQMQRSIREIFDAEKFEPLTLHNFAEYDRLVLQYELHDPSMNVEFPYVVPFSISVPLIANALKLFINEEYEYLNRLIKNEREIILIITKVTDAALTREVNGAMNAVLDHAPQQIHISQAVQFSINASALTEICAFLEKFIAAYDEANKFSTQLANETAELPTSDSTANTATAAASSSSSSSSSSTSSSSAASSHVSSVQLSSARQSFHLLRARCEDLLYELLANKIDSFLSLTANIDWMPSILQKEPSEYIQDLIVYLEATIASLIFVPDTIRDAVHYSSCRRIKDHYLNLLILHVKKFNIVAIYNLHVDLQQLEEFAGRCPIPNLPATFSELRQLCDLFITGDVEKIADQQFRTEKYAHLSVARLLKILDKYKELGLFTAIPPNVKTIKRKTIDNVIKLLQKQ